MSLIERQQVASSLFRLPDLCEWNEMERGRILHELLEFLHEVSILALGAYLQVSTRIRTHILLLATNSLAAVNKVRFVIVDLLDDLAMPLTEAEPSFMMGLMTDRQARARQHLG